MQDYRQSDEYNQYFKSLGWILEKSGSTTVLIKKLPALGSVIKIKKCPPDVNLDQIDDLAKRYRAILIKMEIDINLSHTEYKLLEAQLTQRGYVNSGLAYCPTKTSYIDLTRSCEEILLSFDSDVRNCIKSNQRNGMIVKPAEKMEDLYPLIEYAGKSRRFIFQQFPDWKKQWEVFSNKSRVLLAYSGDKLLGGNMFIMESQKAYGIFLPLSQYGRKSHAAYTLLWEGFKLAKAEGCGIFDLEGIYDARCGSPKAWLGLTAFKRKFRGKEIEFMRPKVKALSWYLKLFAWAGML